MDISGKVIAVTGGASGIGAAVCREARRRGARHVAVIDRNGDEAIRIAAEVSGQAYRCDVSDEKMLSEVVNSIEARDGEIDIFFSNAGIFRSDKDFANVTSATNQDFLECLQINVMAHVFAARSLLPGMLKRGSGHIVLTVSAAGLLTATGSTPYTVSKYAALGFADSLAISTFGTGVQVSAICPEGVYTEMTRSAGLTEADGLLSAESVSKVIADGVEAGTYLVLPHPKVKDSFQKRASDYDLWIEKMARRRAAIERAKIPGSSA
jgi:NAD(P)-dependent dehydrogenase (short-subunit alcohol dehydrogenase family)